MTKDVDPPWDRDLTEAALAADRGMKVVVMSFASDDRGNELLQQYPLYLAAMTFSYAVWENYVEDLGDELTASLAAVLEPNQIPEGARASMADASPWALAVDPGWRGLWQQKVRALTKGVEGEAGWGLNTASKPNIDRVFETVGIDPVPKRLKAPAKVGSGAPESVRNTSESRTMEPSVCHML